MSVAVLHQTLEAGVSECREETLLPRHVEAVDSNTLKISKVGMHVQLASLTLNQSPSFQIIRMLNRQSFTW